MDNLIKNIKSILLVLSVLNIAQLVTSHYFNALSYEGIILSILLEFVFILTFITVTIYSKWINEQLAALKINQTKIQEKIDLAKDSLESDLQLLKIQLSDHVSNHKEKSKQLIDIVNSNKEKLLEEFSLIKNSLEFKISLIEKQISENQSKQEGLINQGLSKNEAINEAILILKQLLIVSIEKLEAKLVESNVESSSSKKELEDKLVVLKNYTTSLFDQLEESNKNLERELSSQNQVLKTAQNEKLEGLKSSLIEKNIEIINRIESREESNTIAINELDSNLSNQIRTVTNSLNDVNNWNESFEKKIEEDIQLLLQNYTGTSTLISEANQQISDLITESNLVNNEDIALYKNELEQLKTNFENTLGTQINLILEEQKGLKESTIANKSQLETTLLEGLTKLQAYQNKLEEQIKNATSNSQNSIIEEIRNNLENKLSTNNELIQNQGNEIAEHLSKATDDFEKSLETRTDKIREEQSHQHRQLIDSEKNLEASILMSIKESALNESKSHLIKMEELMTLMEKIELFNQELSKSTSQIGINQDKTLKVSNNINDALAILPKELFEKIENQKQHLDFNLIKQTNGVYARIDALLSIHNLIQLNAPLPIMHDWRVSSDFAHSLINSLLNKKGSAIDIGSGISTLLMGYAVKKNGMGKVISLEHDNEYFEKTKQLIFEHKLEDYIDLYLCPLIKYKIDNDDWLWYDISKVQFPRNISIISVDGPPGVTQYMARYPAIPLLKDYLSRDTTIYLDDANRKEESEIANQWQEKFNLECELNKNHKGTYKFFIKE